jgi:hypothetical protein
MSLIKQHFPGLSDESIDVMQRLNPDELFANPHTNPARAFELAKGVQKSVELRQRALGQAVESAETQAIKQVGKRAWDTSAHGQALEDITKNLGQAAKVHVEGFKPVLPDKVLGMDIVNRIRSKLGSVIEGRPSLARPGQAAGGAFSGFEGVGGRKVFAYFGSPNAEGIKRSTLNLGQAQQVFRDIDRAADEIFLHPRISGLVKSKMAVFLKNLRTDYHQQLGLSPSNQAFSSFKQLLDVAKFDNPAALIATESVVKNFRTQPGIIKDNVGAVLSRLGAKGKRMLGDIQALNTVDELRGVSAMKAGVQKLESRLASKQIFSTTVNRTPDIFLEGISDRFAATPALANRAFFKDAQGSLAMRSIMNDTNPNLLRVMAIARILGIGTAFGGGAFAGFEVGGPLGGVIGAGAGATAALTVTNPRMVVRGIVALKKREAALAAAQKALGAKTGRVTQPIRQTGRALAPASAAAQAALLRKLLGS